MERPHDADEEVDRRVLLVSTHSYDEAEFYSDRIAVLVTGRLLIHDVPARIRSIIKMSLLMLTGKSPRWGPAQPFSLSITSAINSQRYLVP